MFKKKEGAKKHLFSSVVPVILLINLCSIVVLSAFNYYVFHHKSGQAYLNSFVSYNEKVTDLAFGNIDRQIMQSALKLPQLYFSPIQENDPVLLPQKEYIAGSSVNTRALITEMGKLRKSCPYIAGIDVYYEATNTVVTGFDRVHFPRGEALLQTYIPWYEPYKQAGQPKGFFWTEGDAYLMEKPVILCISRVPMASWNDKDIVLAIYIDPDSFSAYIDQKEGRLVIKTKAESLVYDSKPETEPITTAQADKSGGKNQIEFHDFAETSGLKYYYYVDRDYFFKDYDVTNRMFFVSFLLSIVFDVIVLFVLSYYNYNAYRKRVQTMSREAGIVIGNSEKSFDRSLNALTREISTLHAAMDSSKGLLFQSAVRSLILDQKNGEKNEKITAYLMRPNCCVVLIKLQEKDRDALSVEELQASYPPGHRGYDALFATVELQELAAVLIFDDDRWDETRKAFVQELNDRWKNYRLVYGRAMAIGDAGVKNSYRSAVDAARYQYIFCKEKYLSYEQIKIKDRKGSGSHLKLFEAIRRDINNENLLDLKSNVDMLVFSFKNGNYTIEYCISTLRDFVTLLYQAMQQNQLDMWVVFGYDIRDYYKQIPDIEVFQDWCDTVCESILKNIHQKKQSVDGDMHSKILRLVDEHLENDISLDFLADQLKIRPDVASRMFRQIMGTGYTEYIKNRKLDRAKELMAQGFSVKDTAERLGYSSSQYFIKVFKENYGVTPFQYTKNQSREQSPRD